MDKILKQKTNIELNMHIKSLAQKERELLSEVLDVIKEIDQRKMYLDMGYCSLFSYLTEHVGYSAASAQRRIDGARLLRQIPEVSLKLESGELKLNQISLVQKEIREFEKNKTKKLSRDEKIELLSLVQDKTYEQSQKIVAKYLDKPIQEITKLKTQKDESVRIELTLSKEQYEKLKLAQDLISHAEPTSDLVKFIEYVSSKIIQKKLGNSKESHGAASTSEVNIEKFSLNVKKEVLRTQQCCQYTDPSSGKKCGSSKFLQVDHIQPKWAQGSHRIENAQILCANHNKFKYRKEAGFL